MGGVSSSEPTFLCRAKFATSSVHHLRRIDPRQSSHLYRHRHQPRRRRGYFCHHRRHRPDGGEEGVTLPHHRPRYEGGLAGPPGVAPKHQSGE